MSLENRTWKERLYEIVFKADTPKGKAFDVALIFLIIVSSTIVLLDSVEGLNRMYGTVFLALEWFFVIIFSVEYILRIILAENKIKYITSFYGIIDLISILPAVVSFFIPTAQLLLVVRSLRLLRLFRVLKMARYVQESSTLMKALRASRPKIIVFIFTMFSIVTIVGTLMYLIEGPQNGYKSIPDSMYCAIVTVTTVGYGDISPNTPVGKFIASILMFSAYGVLAVPTGIFTYELTRVPKQSFDKTTCPNCLSEDQSSDAIYCNKCGSRIKE